MTLATITAKLSFEANVEPQPESGSFLEHCVSEAIEQSKAAMTEAFRLNRVDLRFSVVEYGNVLTQEMPLPTWSELDRLTLAS